MKRIALEMLQTVCALALVACAPEPTEAPAPGGLMDGATRWPDAPQELTPTEQDDEENPWLQGWSMEATVLDSERPNSAMEPSVPRDATPSLPSIDNVPGAEDDEPSTRSLLDRRFSEYWEGAGSEKLLMLVGEPGPSPEPCVVEIYSNGGTSPWRRIEVPEVFPETGQLGLCHDSAFDSRCVGEISGSVFNGNDALILRCGDQVMDTFGRRGEDPGKAWDDDFWGLSSEGQRLARCPGAVDVAPDDEFNLADEWRLWTGEEPDCSPLTNENGGAGGAPVR